MHAVPPYRIYLLSNATVEQLKDVLECGLRLEGINAHVVIGNYDNIMQDALCAQGFDSVIVYWEAWNLVDGLQTKIELLSSEQRQAIMERLKAEVEAVLGNLQHIPLVVFNRFNAAPFCHAICDTALDLMCHEINSHLENHCPANTRLIDIDSIYREISMRAAIDWRLFYSSKSLYTVAFYRAYVNFVMPVFADVVGKARKALILDCDNTLWHGILGEDGINGISMSTTPKGLIFSEIQRLALELQKRGVLLGLCSKNNPGDVDEVLSSNQEMQIRDCHLAIKKINWNDKVSNLRMIAQDLNIGLDSIVLVDDSPFEIGLVNQQIPEVKTLQVPQSLTTYPDVFRRMAACFYRGSHSDEDSKKTEQYRQNALRKAEQAQFVTLEDYLRSLHLSVTVHCDKKELVARMAQLTQKTNQFNLTTQRYTESELADLLDGKKISAYTFEVTDRFGDYGVVGMAIVRFVHSGEASLDSFLMSCRVLGRHVECAFFNLLVSELQHRGVTMLHAKYRRTSKNAQVAELYDTLGFTLNKAGNEEKCYSMVLVEYRPKDVGYIKTVLLNRCDEVREMSSHG